MKQSEMHTNTMSASLVSISDTVAAFTYGVRFFAYSVFYYFYFGNSNIHSQRVSAA